MNLFLDTLAQDIPECRAVVMFGSATRTVRPADKYSDRDLLFYVTDPDSGRYLDWVRQYAPTWMVIREHNAPTILWLIVYRGGHVIHLSINPVDDLQQLVDEQRLSFDQKRGYEILLDKDGLAVQLPPVEPQPIYEPPSENEFTECVENFIYGTILTAKQIKRGNLWTVQWAQRIEQGFILQMIEWHARALTPGVDTWHRGEFMREWFSPDVWLELHGIVGHFDAEDSWRGLFASLILFRRLAQETAAHLGYPYPETMVAEVVAYLETLRDGES